MTNLKIVFYSAVAIVSLASILLLNGSQNRLIGSPAADESLQSTVSSPGKPMYDAACARCHGLDGRGNGPAASLLHPRPRDFTAGKYKFRSTESGDIPTDDDLITIISNGLHGTTMPDWQQFLHGDSLRAVVEYMKSFSPRFKNEQPGPVRPGSPTASSPQSITAGKKVYEKLECAMCHGDDGMGKGAVATDLIDDWGLDTKATNLTESWTFRGGATARDIYLRFRTGIDGTPMPSYIGSASEKEMWDLANYVVSLSRKPVWQMSVEEVKEFYAAQEADAKNNPGKRGKFLVESMGCGDCHSPIRADGSEIEDLHLAGGQRWSLGPYGSFVTPNLTSDKEAGLGNWTDQEIKNVLSKGIRKDGSRMLPFPMPWPDYSHMSENDMNALISYLRSVPPNSNKIPPREPLNIVSYLVAKFKMLILKEPIVGGVEPGNAGSAKVQLTAHRLPSESREALEQARASREEQP
jgi:mono/diheme cytochrome c family protein